MSSVAEPQLDIKDAMYAIRGPLTIIKTQVALKGSQPPTLQGWKEFIGSIDNQIQYASALLDDIALIWQQMAGLLAVESQKVDLNDVLALCIKKHQDLVISKKINLDFNSGSSTVVINSDRKLLIRLVMAILDNAITYCDPGSKVQISLSEKELTFSDTGWGINKYDLKEVEKPFYRIDEHATKVRMSSGVGLSVASSIAQALGLKMLITSKPQIGTKINILL